MKNAFSTLADPNRSLSQFLDAAPRTAMTGLTCGASAARFDVTRLPDFTDRLDETLNDFATAVSRSPGCPPPPVCSRRSAKRQEHLDEVKRYCTLAAEIVLSANVGRPWIRVFGGKIPRVPVRPGADRCRRPAATVWGRSPAMRGDTIVVETHDDWCASERVRALVEKATIRRSGSCGMCIIPGGRPASRRNRRGRR